MFTHTYKKIKKTLKITAVLLFTGFTFAALGSIGGGSKTKNSNLLKAEFSPIKTNRGFTLRNGLRYTGSIFLKSERTNSYINYNTLVTYQKGNTTYILPNHYKVFLTTSDVKSNLQLLNLRIKLSK